MDNILISVIVTNYNYAHFLSDALQSVAEQSFENWECIIIDDESKDDSRAVAMQFVNNDPRFKYVFQKNQGLAASRNNGIKIARGKYLQFLDADDKINIHKLKEQVRFLEMHNEVDIVYGDFYFFRTEKPDIHYQSKENKVRHNFQKLNHRGKEVLPVLLKDNFMVVSAPIIRKSIFTKDRIHFDITYNTYEDWKFWIECAIADKHFYYLKRPQTETLIRFGHNSMMSAKIRMNRGGLKIRNFISPHLSGSLRLYNAYRKLKLQLKYIYLKSIATKND